MVTLYPLDFNKRPRDAAVIPFPKPDTTPPVTNTYFTGINFPPNKSHEKIKHKINYTTHNK